MHISIRPIWSFVLVLLLIYGGCIEQAAGQAYLKESNNWYFGKRAGLRFTPPDAQGRPTVNTEAALLDAGEGTASMSDTAGNLLFYCGSTENIPTVSVPGIVFNRRHQIMPNGRGIIGGSSSSQNAIAIRMPGSFTNYYLFTVAQIENYRNGLSNQLGFYYTRVDMTLDSGRGDVVVSRKNVQIMDSSTEKISAVLHRNGRDVWILAHQFGNNRFAASLLTDTGVQVPVYSEVGLTHPVDAVNFNNARGCLKISPNGNRVAYAITHSIDGLDYAQVLRFNNLTGQVSEPITLTFPLSTTAFNQYGPYGVEFSPDNSKLYIADRSQDRPNLPGFNIWQYDLCAGLGDSAGVVNSRFGIRTDSMCASIQLGLDGRIYVNRFASRIIAAIRNPNAPGAACNFTNNFLRLPNAAKMDRGLTNVNQSIFNRLNANIQYTRLCEGDTVAFRAEANCQGLPATFLWNFGDTASGAANFSTDRTPRHYYARPGPYPITLLLDQGNLIDTAKAQIVITARARGRIVGQRVSCTGSQVYQALQDTTIPYNVPVAQYRWRVNGLVDTVVQAPGLIEFSNLYTANQQAIVSLRLITRTSLGEICLSDSLTLPVRINEQRGAKPAGPSRLCLIAGQPVAYISADNPRTTYRWSVSPAAGVSLGGQGTAALGVTYATPGTRQIRVDGLIDTANGICYTTSEALRVQVAAPAADSLQILGDSATCEEPSIAYVALGGKPGSTYRWNLLEDERPSNGLATVLSDTTGSEIALRWQLTRFGQPIYTLTAQEISRDGCPGPVATKIIFNSCIRTSNIITPNGDGKNDNFIIPNAALYSDNKLTIHNRWGRQVYSKTGYNNDFDPTSVPTGTYYYRFRAVVEGTERIYQGWLEIVK